MVINQEALAKNPHESCKTLPQDVLEWYVSPSQIGLECLGFYFGNSSTYISVFLVGDMQAVDPSSLIIMGFYHSAAIELADRNFFRTLLILPIASGGGQPERRSKKVLQRIVR